MKKKTELKKALVSGKVCFGTWVQIGSPSVAEILADAGFEWIAVDCEHTDIEINQFSSIISAVEHTGCYSFARVSENSAIVIRKTLDAGAYGVIVPLINTAEQAKKAVAAAKFPPEGIRGFSYCRANRWGRKFDEHAKKANKETMVFAMIETKQGVDNIESILNVDGIDGVFIGPYDLSGSYGIPGALEHPHVEAAKRNVLNACRKHNKIVGQHLVNPTEKSIRHAVEEGYNFIALGMDTVFLGEQSSLVYDRALSFLNK